MHTTDFFFFKETKEMHDCRAVEVSIFHNVGEVSVLLSGVGACLAPAPGPAATLCLPWDVTAGAPG